MAHIKIPRAWEIPEGEATPEHVCVNRRTFLAALGITAIQSRQLYSQRATAADSLYPAKRNSIYKLDRPITSEKDVTHYNNFYEFTEEKDVYKYVDRLKTEPWKVKLTGKVRKSKTFDVDQLLRLMPIEERLYRHRCVEAWAMAVPWSGFRLKALLDLVEPTSDAKFVRFVSFYRPLQAPNQKEPNWIGSVFAGRWYPWPYYESLTIEEARNELTFLATGLYGHALAKQNGAPIRLVVPWKYGFKSIKSIVQIELTSRKPGTFWNDIAPGDNDWLANVNPNESGPRYSQALEHLLGTWETRQTLPYNGYGEFVAHLYNGM